MILGLVLIGIGTWMKLHEDHGPLSQKIQHSVAFPLYYPLNMPEGYRHHPKSDRNDNGIIFFDISDANYTIHVSQQARPSNPPDLNNLNGFTKFESLAGPAAAGSNNNSPTAIILSDSTLITINGSIGTPKEIVSAIARSMSLLTN